MFKLIKRLFKKEEEEVTEKKYSTTWLIENEEIIFNVDNFNFWFNNPNNNAVYAHSGIYLRLDKLSEAHIVDYLLKEYELENGAFLFSKPYNTMVSNLLRDVQKDWKNKKQ